ncbi:MAG: hypothetical protein LBB74_01705 [Chitinispirillales bacterium]|jgi:hypothetical protein|nr:hypothetical protein [Chitinispirillales bacterium]
MNRLTRYLSGAFAALLATATPTLCADLLLDDFTDATASHGKWVNKNSTFLSHDVAGGNCTLVNSSPTYAGEYSHDFGASKPATFTLSYVHKSTQGRDAGAFFCRQPGNEFSGYFITLRGSDLFVWKLSNGNSGGNSIFSKTVGYALNSAGNKITVSKSSTKFNVFVNDVFAGSFTDATYNSGDLSLFIDPETRAVFGTVQVTDTFKEGSPQTSFSDDFNGNSLSGYWQILKSPSTSPSIAINQANNVLTIKTATDDAAWMYIEFEHLNFTAKVEASHRSGLKSSAYGFVLIGDAQPGQNIPMAYFAITGDREYAMWASGTTANYTSSPAILGAASGGQFFVDRLEVRKSAGSSAYEFWANGTQLAAYPAANVNFNVVGVGIFCYGDLEIAFDNFSILKEGTTSIDRGSKQISCNPSSVTNRDHTFYDMRGRKRYITTSTAGRAQTRAAGIYVNKNGRDVAVRKGKPVGE